MALGQSDLGELVIDRPRELCLKAVADEDARPRPMLAGDQPERMPGTEYQRVAAIQAKRDAALLAGPFALYLDRGNACA